MREKDAPLHPHKRQAQSTRQVLKVQCTYTWTAKSSESSQHSICGVFSNYVMTYSVFMFRGLGPMACSGPEQILQHNSWRYLVGFLEGVSAKHKPEARNTEQCSALKCVQQDRTSRAVKDRAVAVTDWQLKWLKLIEKSRHRDSSHACLRSKLAPECPVHRAECLRQTESLLRTLEIPAFYEIRRCLQQLDHRPTPSQIKPYFFKVFFCITLLCASVTALASPSFRFSDQDSVCIVKHLLVY